MPSLKIVVTVLCVISGVTGLSVAVVSGWAIYIKEQGLDEIYPDAEKFETQMKNESHNKVWENLKNDWKSSQTKDVALLGLCLGAGVLQFIVGLCVLYTGEDANNDRKLASRFVICNIVTFLVLLGCAISTTTIDHLTILNIPFQLRQAMELNEFPVISFLKFCINGFTIWIIMDLIFLLVNNVIICCFLKRSATAELIIVGI